MADQNDSTRSPEAVSADDNKSFFTTAQETVTGAVGAAVGAVKERPVAAAAIAAGAAAAVAGAAYGATKLREGDTTTSRKN